MSWEIVLPALIGGGLIGAISSIIITLITVKSNQPGLMGKAYNDLMTSLKLSNETNQSLQTWANKLELELTEEKKNSLERAVSRERKHKDEIEQIKDEFAAKGKKDLSVLTIALETMRTTLIGYQGDVVNNASKIRALETNLDRSTLRVEKMEKNFRTLCKNRDANVARLLELGGHEIPLPPLEPI